MAKELYLYSQIWDFIAQELMQQMEDNQGEDITIRVCSPGGSVFAGWGIIAKMGECEGALKVKVDGFAASMAAFALLFCDDVEGLSSSTYVLHRADMYVGDPEDQEFLDKVNAQLKKAFIKRLDNDKLKELKGVTINDIFNPDTRINVALNAEEAKAIGLITSIKKVTPAIKAEVKSKMSEVTQLYRVAATTAANPEIKPLKKDKMILAELKAAHPALYAEIIALGKTEGIAEEQDRVNAAMVFVELDPKGVKEIIKSGKPMTQTQMAEFSMKSLSATQLALLKKEAPAPTDTTAVTAPVLTDKEKEIKAFEEEVFGKEKTPAATATGK